MQIEMTAKFVAWFYAAASVAAKGNLCVLCDFKVCPCGNRSFAVVEIFNDKCGVRMKYGVGKKRYVAVFGFVFYFEVVWYCGVSERNLLAAFIIYFGVSFYGSIF